MNDDSGYWTLSPSISANIVSPLFLPTTLLYLGTPVQQYCLLVPTVVNCVMFNVLCLTGCQDEVVFHLLQRLHRRCSNRQCCYGMCSSKIEDFKIDYSATLCVK